jgi:endonuclease YncB( thermonuclease family)
MMSKWMLCLGLCTLGALGATPAVLAATSTGLVTAVEDGAHITVQVEGRAQRVTLIGVDVSEPGACEGRGTPYLRSLLLGKQVQLVDDRKQTQSGARLSYVYLPDGTFANERVIANGFARMGRLGVNTAHAGELVVAQNLARSRHLCVWVGTRPVFTGYAHSPRRLPVPTAAKRTMPSGGGGGLLPRLPAPPPGWRPPTPPHFQPPHKER